MGSGRSGRETEKPRGLAREARLGRINSRPHRSVSQCRQRSRMWPHALRIHRMLDAEEWSRGRSEKGTTTMNDVFQTMRRVHTLPRLTLTGFVVALLVGTRGASAMGGPGICSN